MLRPIPLKILRHSATLRVPNGTDRYNAATYSEYSLNRINIQPSNAVTKTKDNKEVVLRSVLFFDVRNSTPGGLDFDTLQNQANTHGSQMKVVSGNSTYTVETVDPIGDDGGNIHHYEIGLT